MKRYLVFGGNCFYPGGGWNDFICSTDDELQAIEIAANFARRTSPREFTSGRWSHVYDTDRENVVKEWQTDDFEQLPSASPGNDGASLQGNEERLFIKHPHLGQEAIPQTDQLVARYSSSD